MAADCSILAVVGDGMAGTPGAAAKVFGALSKAAVNVRAIAQGASERNISVVIEAARRDQRAARGARELLPVAATPSRSALIGPGLVGSALLDAARRRRRSGCARERNLDLRVRGIISSRKMVLSDAGIALDGDWRGALDAGADADLAAFEEHIHADHLPHALLIDCTASADVAAQLPALARGRHSHRHAEQAGGQRPGSPSSNELHQAPPRRAARIFSTKRRSARRCR